METRDLIKALSADAAQRGPRLTERWRWTIAAALAVAAAVFFACLAPRADLAAAFATPRFLFKLAVVLLAAAVAVPLVAAAGRPQRVAPGLLWLLPAVLAAGVAGEWLVTPPEERLARLMGLHNLACLGLVTLIGIGPLVAFLAFLRHGAPLRPVRAGALAGLAAGAIATSLYAFHCTDDSPFFVATWYVGAVLGLCGLGALAGHRLLRW